MARKPPDWHQSSLFPTDPDTNTEPPNQSPPETEGDHHAIQDHRSRTPATTAGDARPAPEGAKGANDNGTIRTRAEDQPPSVEGNARQEEAGQQPGADHERSAGDSAQGTGGSFAARITSERQRNTFPRRGDGIYPQT